MEFRHVAFDVLHHHDGVIHHDADAQHQAEQGQHVDREAEQVHPAEGGDHRDDHRHDGNDRGPPALQEDEDHHDDQHDGFQQGFHHLVDRGLHELGGIQGDGVIDASREALLQFLQSRPHLFGNFQGVGTRLLIHGDGGTHLAVETAAQIIALHPQGHVADILEPQHARAGGTGTQDDVLELLRRTQSPLGRDRKGQFHRPIGRRLTDLANGELLVLGLDGVDDFVGGQAQVAHPIRFQPDPHGVIGNAENTGLISAGNSLQCVEHIQVGVIADIGFILASIR